MLTPTSTELLMQAHATGSGDEKKYVLSLLSPHEALGDPAVRLAWESLLNLSNPLNRVVTSPTFYEQESGVSRRTENQVAVVRDGADRIVAICPIMYWALSIPFQIKRRILGNIALDAATILSGEPLAPADPEIYRYLFDGLLQHLPWCDCIYLNSIPADSFTSRFLVESYGHTGSHFVYPRRLKNRLLCYTELGNSFDEFLRTKQSNTRYQLKRRIRKLKEHGRGLLECRRIETPDQVDEFYPAALAIHSQSWQSQGVGRPLEETALNRERLISSAKLGYLRAYLLECGGQPCAFGIGYQNGDVFLYEQSAYSQKWKEFSAGSVLFYLLMEDLYKHRPPRLLNFGTGINPLKQIFSNKITSDTCLYVFRMSFRNLLRMAAHSLFCDGLELTKKLLKKRPPVGDAGDVESSSE